MYQPIEELEVYRLTCELADELSERVESWTRFRQETVGLQLCTATDSVAANLVEGDSRTSDRDSLRFFDISRASCREAQHWMRRAVARRFIGEEEGNDIVARLEIVGRMVTALMRHRRKALGVVRELDAFYDTQASPESPDIVISE